MEPTENPSAKTCHPERSEAVSHEREKTLASKDCTNDDFFRQVNIEFLIHELKDPVSVIETGARMLLDKQDADAPLSTTQQRTLERVLRNTRKTRDMLAQLLEIGRAQSVCFHCRPFQPYGTVQNVLFQAIEAGDPELYDRMKKVRETTDRLAFLSRCGIRLDVAAAVENLAIEQDEIKFRQIVSNLIKNGLSYRRRHLLIHLAIQHKCVCISVRDDGPGIAPPHQELIFQRYKQVAPCEGLARGGHGLGLAVARILARSLGGDIIVESELGLGALFRFILPVAFPVDR
ncbi:MAG: sensor histidine kinase [Desulfobacteraceae bacterium]|nr:MAG: sensor histidine kinase [Desulfobacteraceae bacterium]